MSNLNNIIDQIQELIKNQKIEWKEIKDICEIRRGSFPQPYTDKKWYGGNGSMPFIQVADMNDDNFLLKNKTNKTISIEGQKYSYLVPKNSIICSIQGTIGRIAETQYDAYIDRTIALFNNFKIKLINKFFIYSLKIKFNYEKQFARGTTLKTITKEEIKKFKIPIPPLEIQNKIVEILDNFSNYETELETELETRTKQYNYYLNKLLDFSNSSDVEWKSLWEITIWNKRFRNVEKNKQKEILKCFSVSSKDLNNIQQDQNGDIKLLSTKKNDQRFTSEQFCKKFNVDEVISIPEGGDANIKYTNGKFVNSLNLLCKSYDNKKVNLKFIYYYLVCNKFLIINQYLGSAIKHPQMDKILEIQIPIPPLETQNKIVEILDNFSSLVNDIKDGLPKEIQLRKKQYSYYLNKLLDFK